MRHKANCYSILRTAVKLDTSIVRIRKAIIELNIPVVLYSKSFHYITKADVTRLEAFFLDLKTNYVFLEEFAKQTYYSVENIKALIRKGKITVRKFVNRLYIHQDQIKIIRGFQKMTKFEASSKMSSKFTNNFTEIAALYNRGYSIKELSKLFLIPYHTLYRALNIKQVTGRSVLDQYATAVSFYLDNGYKVRSISTLLGIKYHLVHNYVYKNLKNKVQPRVAKLSKHKDEIIQLLNNGLKVVDVALILNVNKTCMYSFLRREQLLKR